MLLSAVVLLAVLFAVAPQIPVLARILRVPPAAPTVANGPAGSGASASIANPTEESEGTRLVSEPSIEDPQWGDNLGDEVGSPPAISAHASPFRVGLRRNVRAQRPSGSPRIVVADSLLMLGRQGEQSMEDVLRNPARRVGTAHGGAMVLVTIAPSVDGIARDTAARSRFRSKNAPLSIFTIRLKAGSKAQSGAGIRLLDLRDEDILSASRDDEPLPYAAWEELSALRDKETVGLLVRSPDRSTGVVLEIDAVKSLLDHDLISVESRMATGAHSIRPAFVDEVAYKLSTSAPRIRAVVAVAGCAAAIAAIARLIE